MKRKPSIPSIIVTSASLYLLTGAAYGAGFALIEQSASSLGSAFAGGSAVAEDASILYFNPAAMTDLEPAQAVFGLHLIRPSTRFSDTASSGPRGAALGNDEGGDAGTLALVPNVYYLGELTPRTMFGFGINAPFGLSTEYDKSWMGRYHAIESHMQTVNINPSLAYEVTDQLSLGAGISLQYLSVELTNAIDQPTLCAGLATRVPPLTACAGLPTSNDGHAEVSGTSWGWGFNLGVVYKFDDDTHLGAAWRSSIKHELEGDAEFDGIHPALLATGFFVDTDASAEVELPATLSLSAFHRIDSRWTVMGDVTWTQWSTFEELRIEYENGSQGDTVQDESWENTFRYAVGVHYRHDEQWMFRAGIAYDETPIPDAEHRTPRIPGNDRTWIAVGMNYRLTPQLSFDVGYAHLFVDKTAIRDTNSLGTSLKGSYRTSVDILSGQINWRF